MEDLNFDKEEVRKNLLENRHNNNTTCYYLLLKINIKRGLPTVSDLISKEFIKYLENPKNLKINKLPKNGTNAAACFRYSDSNKILFDNKNSTINNDLFTENDSIPQRALEPDAWKHKRLLTNANKQNKDIRMSADVKSIFNNITNKNVATNVNLNNITCLNPTKTNAQDTEASSKAVNSEKKKSVCFKDNECNSKQSQTPELNKALIDRLDNDSHINRLNSDSRDKKINIVNTDKNYDDNENYSFNLYIPDEYIKFKSSVISKRESNINDHSNNRANSLISNQARNKISSEGSDNNKNKSQAEGEEKLNNCIAKTSINLPKIRVIKFNDDSSYNYANLKPTGMELKHINKEKDKDITKNYKETTDKIIRNLVPLKRFSIINNKPLTRQESNYTKLNNNNNISSNPISATDSVSSINSNISIACKINPSVGSSVYILRTHNERVKEQKNNLILRESLDKNLPLLNNKQKIKSEVFTKLDSDGAAFELKSKSIEISSVGDYLKEFKRQKYFKSNNKRNKFFNTSMSFENNNKNSKASIVKSPDISEKNNQAGKNANILNTSLNNSNSSLNSFKNKIKDSMKIKRLIPLHVSSTNTKELDIKLVKWNNKENYLKVKSQFKKFRILRQHVQEEEDQNKDVKYFSILTNAFLIKEKEKDKQEKLINASCGKSRVEDFRNIEHGYLSFEKKLCQKEKSLNDLEFKHISNKSSKIDLIKNNSNISNERCIENCDEVVTTLNNLNYNYNINKNTTTSSSTNLYNNNNDRDQNYSKEKIFTYPVRKASHDYERKVLEYAYSKNFHINNSSISHNHSSQEKPSEKNINNNKFTFSYSMQIKKSPNVREMYLIGSQSKKLTASSQSRTSNTVRVVKELSSNKQKSYSNWKIKKTNLKNLQGIFFSNKCKYVNNNLSKDSFSFDNSENLVANQMINDSVRNLVKNKEKGRDNKALIIEGNLKQKLNLLNNQILTPRKEKNNKKNDSNKYFEVNFLKSELDETKLKDKETEISKIRKFNNYLNNPTEEKIFNKDDTIELKTKKLDDDTSKFSFYDSDAIYSTTLKKYPLCNSYRDNKKSNIPKHQKTPEQNRDMGKSDNSISKFYFFLL